MLRAALKSMYVYPKLLLDAEAAAAAPPLPPAAVTAAEDGECKGVEGRPMRAVEAEVAAAVARPPTAPPLDAGEGATAHQRRRAARLAQAQANRKEDRKRYWMWVKDTITLEGTGARADREVSVWRAKSATLFCDPADPMSGYTPLNYGAPKQDRFRELVVQIVADMIVDGRSGKRELLHYRAVAMSFDQFSAAAIEASALVPYVDPRHYFAESLPSETWEFVTPH